MFELGKEAKSPKKMLLVKENTNEKNETNEVTERTEMNEVNCNIQESQMAVRSQFRIRTIRIVRLSVTRVNDDATAILKNFSVYTHLRFLIGLLCQH